MRCVNSGHNTTAVYRCSCRKYRYVVSMLIYQIASFRIRFFIVSVLEVQFYTSEQKCRYNKEFGYDRKGDQID